MTIKFCGAAREVTGSSHLITLEDGFRILLDCGLYQGVDDEVEDSPVYNFNERWLFSPQQVNCLILSHAHIDHTGRVPKLVADGFRGTIYATHATRDLCAIMLADSAKIQEADAQFDNKRRAPGTPERKPLYTLKDVHSALRNFAAFGYEQWFYVHPRVRVLFRDAGHILGSASVTLEIREGSRTVLFGFTGDLGRPSRPILRDPQPMPEVEYLICESTYGDREHEAAPAELERLFHIVRHTCVEKKGKLIIPAFSVGRTQEFVYMLDQLHRAGRLPKVPIFVDSPLAVDATEVFLDHPECFDQELHQYMLEDENPFGFKELQYIRSVEASKQLNHMQHPCIIIAASGMMNAGRIRHHLYHNIENPRATFLIIGYCAPNTPGGKLRAGATSLEVFGERKQVLAEVEVMDSFSAHADRTEMLQFLQNQRASIRQLWLTHGTLDRQQVWRDTLLQHGFSAVDIPALGQEYTL
ncbi:MAG: MBL fold metallo-hydrolase [Saprospiraceae bacterium]|nr:MBL fold metallo-hydrolase [Saprospiraceae bacterium]MDW8483912.1 MBL fold metallo-hydrolase [Saprospiraceae bacterium]